jgi:hypothetical protein
MKQKLAAGLIAASGAMPILTFGPAAVLAGDVRTGMVVMPADGARSRAFVCNYDECIVVGKQSKWYVWFWCYKGTQYLDDKVTVTVADFPRGRGENPPAYVPRKIPTTKNPSNPAPSERSLVTIDTKYFDSQPSSKPGLYPLHFTGKGEGKNECPVDYEAGIARLQVRPKITVELAESGKPKDGVWWFDNAPPGPLEELGYTLKLELTAHGEDKAHTWKIEQKGGDYAEFEGGGTTKTTQPNKVKLKPNRNIKKPADLPKGKGIFKVTVTVNGAESDPVSLRVRRPYDAVPIGTVDDDLSTHGYFSLITYSLRDQFGKPLPKRVPKREHFTLNGGEVEKDLPGTNWSRVKEAGGEKQPPGVLKDEITGQKECVDITCLVKYEPSALKALTDKKITPVIHWSGWVSIGSKNLDGQPDDPAAKPIGVKIMNLTWQKFRDRARHCDIASPPDAAAICPCETIRKTGEKCTK